MNKNFDLVDIAKFILALCVVAIHSRLLHEHIYPFARLAVPMFFLFSGYFSFMHIDATQGKKGKNQQVFRIIKRLMELYLFWFVLLLPYTLLLRNYFQEGFLYGIGTMVRSLFFDSTFPGSWYIMATVLGILIIYKLSNYLSNLRIFLITLLIYIITTITTEFRVEIISLPTLGTALSLFEHYIGIPCFTFMIGLFYIAFGKIMADSPKLLMIFRRLHMINIMALFACIIGLLMEYNFRISSQRFSYACDCLIMLAPTALVMVMIILTSDLKIKNTVLLRKLSTIIYCSHIPIVAVVSRLLHFAGIADSECVLTYIITVSLAIALGGIIIKLEKNEHFRFLKFSH